MNSTLGKRDVAVRDPAKEDIPETNVSPVFIYHLRSSNSDFQDSSSNNNNNISSSDNSNSSQADNSFDEDADGTGRISRKHSFAWRSSQV